MAFVVTGSRRLSSPNKEHFDVHADVQWHQLGCTNIQQIPYNNNGKFVPMTSMDHQIQAVLLNMWDAEKPNRAR